MEQKDKELLLKDLCARLPYGVKVQCENYPFPVTVLYAGNVNEVKFKETGGIECICIIKPYLRPMSSMTKEEDKEWQIYKNNIACAYGENLNERINELYDWFNKHHFDFRGLIEKGLALEAPEDMYNI